MNVLDLFCGLGGWSKGFAKEGFKCTGIDIVNVGYPFEFIKKDILELDSHLLNWLKRQEFKVIVGSPPCRDFSLLTNFGKKYWKDPPNPKRGLELVNKFLEIVFRLNPPYWVMENVPQLQKYLGLKSNCIVKMKTPRFKRSLWGRFPNFLVPYVKTTPVEQIGGKLRSWKRAEIPFQVSQSLANAIKQNILGKEVLEVERFGIEANVHLERNPRTL